MPMRCIALLLSLLFALACDPRLAGRAAGPTGPADGGNNDVQTTLTCAAQQGQVCGGDQSCPQAFLVASDSARCCGVSCLTVGALTSAQWSQSGFDARKSGQSPYRGPTQHKLKWLHVLAGGMAGNVVVGRDGTAYFVQWQGQDAELVALSANGLQRWVRPVAVGSPTIGPDHNIYVRVTRNNADAIVAYDEAGAEQWSFAPGAPVSADLVVADDGTIYFATADGAWPEQQVKLFALDSTGQQLWSTALSSAGYAATPAVAGDTLYAGGERLRAIDRSDGSVRWEAAVQTLGGPYGPAVAPDGTVIVATTQWELNGAAELCAFAPDGTERWRLGTGFMEMTPAISSDGKVVFHAFRHPDPSLLSSGLFAVDLASGTLSWSLLDFILLDTSDPDISDPVSGSDSSPIIDADGVIYMGAENGSLFAIRPDGTLLWELPLGFELDNRSAIGSDGTLYLCNAGGPGHTKCYAISDQGTLDPPSDPWDGWTGGEETLPCGPSGTSCEVSGEYGCACATAANCSTGEMVQGCCIGGPCS